MQFLALGISYTFLFIMSLNLLQLTVPLYALYTF